MKRSIKHLPKRTQEELNTLLELINRYVPWCNMVVLYGSYARGGYVLWDERVEFDVHTSYQSDYDLMLVVPRTKVKQAEDRLSAKVMTTYDTAFAHRRHAPFQVIVESADRLNKELERSQYFFTEVIKYGIKLYDNGAFKLAKPRRLSYREIKSIAEDEFKACSNYGNDYLKHANDGLGYGSFNTASFLTHQACERFYHCINLVFTNYRPKCHKLDVLGRHVKKFSRDLIAVFPQNTDFEVRCFDLLCRAYIEARYNRHFTVTNEDLTYMLARTRLLQEITYRICTEQIASYDALIEQEK